MLPVVNFLFTSPRHRLIFIYRPVGYVVTYAPMAKTFLTYTSGLVLEAIAAGYKYGFDVMDATGLPSGTVYPAMRKLERNGFVRSKWEQEKAAWRNQRPARRYYTITASGAEALAELRKRFHGLQRAIAPAEGT